jgi:hypothetical protein
MSLNVRSIFWLGLGFALVPIFLPSCGGSKSDKPQDSLAQVTPLEKYPELGLARSADSLNGSLTLQTNASNGQTYTYGYNAQKELVRAQLKIEVSGETYEFIFQPDGAAGLCKLTSSALSGWAPLREERPIALVTSFQGPEQTLSASSLDSLAEILLSYRMDLMVSEP